jgi:hypothetical protein
MVWIKAVYCKTENRQMNNYRYLKTSLKEEKIILQQFQNENQGTKIIHGKFYLITSNIDSSRRCSPFFIPSLYMHLHNAYVT